MTKNNLKQMFDNIEKARNAYFDELLDHIFFKSEHKSVFNYQSKEILKLHSSFTFFYESDYKKIAEIIFDIYITPKEEKVSMSMNTSNRYLNLANGQPIDLKSVSLTKLDEIDSLENFMINKIIHCVEVIPKDNLDNIIIKPNQDCEQLIINKKTQNKLKQIIRDNINNLEKTIQSSSMDSIDLKNELIDAVKEKNKIILKNYLEKNLSFPALKKNKNKL